MIAVYRAGSAYAALAAGVLAQALRARLETQDRVSFAVSGGSTPGPVFRALADLPIDWPRVDVYQVDERVAPEGDAARNLTGLRASLLDHVDAVAHPMPVEADELDAAAHEYAAKLPPVLDVVHLGLGDDGHTASLVPDDPVLDVRGVSVAMTGPYRGHRRMTLTFTPLARANELVWIVAGRDKTPMTRRLLDADPRIPAGRLPQDRAILVTDEPEDEEPKGNANDG
jgi:6-phosphogluconolactonase